MNLNNETKGSLFVLSGCAVWGTIGIFVKLLNAEGSTSTLTSFLRMAFAFVILLVITLIKDGPESFKIDRKSLLACALLGLICHGIYNVCYSMAVVRAGVAVGAVLLNVAPFFTAIVSMIFFSEHLGGRKWFAIALKILGCVLATAAGISFSGTSFAGILFGVAAGFCYSLTPIFGKIAGEKVSVFVMSTYSYLFAACFLGIATRPWTVAAAGNPKILGIAFLYALFPTAIAYVLYYHGTNLITEMSKVPVFASTETVVAILLGVLIYKEIVTPVNLIGIGMIFLSVFLMSRRNS